VAPPYPADSFFFAPGSACGRRWRDDGPLPYWSLLEEYFFGAPPPPLMEGLRLASHDCRRLTVGSGGRGPARPVSLPEARRSTAADMTRGDLPLLFVPDATKIMLFTSFRRAPTLCHAAYGLGCASKSLKLGGKIVRGSARISVPPVFEECRLSPVGSLMIRSRSL